MRPLSNGKADRYELVAGARRYRASKAAGRESIPARVVPLTDAEAVELQCIENVLRDDLHELEEAEGYLKLLEIGKNYTPDVIALKIGKSRQYVHGRLQLLKLEPKLKDAFYQGHMNVAVALRLARLQPANQLAAFKYFQGNGHSSTEFTTTVRDGDEWIRREVFLNLDSAAFKKDDATLYPEAGPCTTCPKRSPAELKAERLGRSVGQARQTDGFRPHISRNQRTELMTGRDLVARFLQAALVWRWRFSERER